MTADWNIMVYMAGNNSLSGAATEDLSELQNIGSTDRVKVTAFMKQRGEAARYMVVTRGGLSDVESLPPGTDSGSPQTVVDFIRWAVRRGHAKRHALVLWNHGGAWSPDDFDQLYSEVRGQRNRYESNRLASNPLTRAFFTESVKTTFGRTNALERAICSDDVTHHSLDTVEVENIMRAAKEAAHRPFELLGMDACLMSTLEVAYQVRQHVHAVVGSEELEPFAGWAYEPLLKALNAAPDSNGPALAKMVVDTYINSYRTSPGEWPVTQCALHAEHLELFAHAFDTFTNALRARLRVALPDITTAHARAVHFMFEMIDLQSFCRELGAITSDPLLRRAAHGITALLEPGAFVVGEGHLGPSVEKAGGVSIYMPSPIGGQISPEYARLSFAKRHRWDEFLQEYFKAQRG